MREIGRRYHRLMTEALGYERYIVFGGDQGAISATYMALEYPQSVAGLRQPLVFPRHRESPYASGEAGPNPTPAELAFAKREKTIFDARSAYSLTHLLRAGDDGQPRRARLMDRRDVLLLDGSPAQDIRAGDL